jgi:hypothetical protein
MLNDRRPSPKIPLHDQLTDLGVQLLDVRLAHLPASIGPALENCGQVLDRLLLPGVDHRLVHSILGPQLRQRQLAADRLQCHFRLELRAVTLPCRLAHPSSSFSGRAKLNCLSDS